MLSGLCLARCSTLTYDSTRPTLNDSNTGLQEGHEILQARFGTSTARLKRCWVYKLLHELGTARVYGQYKLDKQWPFM